MKKYVGINTSFGHNVLENFDEYEFRTNMSLFDYDAVILSTYFVTSNYKYETTNSYEKTPRKYQGIIVLDEDDSFNIIREFQCMKKQLQDMLKIGKNIFVILEKNEKRYIYNGEKAVSGSGKNATRTSYVQEIDENGFLPVDVKLESLLGEVTQVVAKDEYRDFYDSVRDLYLYQQIIKEPNGETDVIIPGTSNAVAMHMKYGKGNIVFIPRPYEEEEYIDDKDAQEKPLYFLKQILALDEKLNSRSQYSELPNWAKNIRLFDEKKYVEKNEAIDKKIEKLIEEKNKNSKVLNEISNEVVVEGYSGAGLLSCIMAKRAKEVYSVEIEQSATKDANDAKKLNKLDNLHNINGDCDVEMEKLLLQNSDATVVLDPPRSGVGRHTLEMIAKTLPNKIVMISCNPYTLRQNVVFLNKFYNIKSFEIFDMFPQTSHIESFVVLERK